jgi:putative inorganic carbon (HCO3(-)) transporter
MFPRTIKPKTIQISVQWLAIILLGVFLGFFTLFTLKLPSKWIPLILLAGVLPFAALVIGNLRKILLALIILDIPLQLDIALGSSWVLNYTGAINGYIISVTTICLTILYVLWILEYLVKKDIFSNQSIRRPNVYLTLYLFITCLSLVLGYFQRLASYEVFLLVQTFLLYVYVINNVRDREGVWFIVVMLLVGVITESLIIILMQVAGTGFSVAGIIGNIYAQSATPDGISRIGGTLKSANLAGSYLSMLLVPTFSILTMKQERLFKWLAMMAFICGAIALILTGSRGAWLATFVSFLIFGYYAFRKGWLNLRVLVIGVVIGILILLVFYTPIYQRVFGDDAGAAAGRIPQYQIAFQIIREDPIIGVGANNYPVIQRWYLAQDPNNKVFKWAVHNKYLLVWAETGFFGLLFFVLFLISTIHQGFKITRVNDLRLAPLALGFTAAIMGLMVHMFFDVFHSRSDVQLLWLVAGLLMSMGYLLQPVKDFNQ